MSSDISDIIKRASVELVSKSKNVIQLYRRLDDLQVAVRANKNLVSDPKIYEANSEALKASLKAIEKNTQDLQQNDIQKKIACEQQLLSGKKIDYSAKKVLLSAGQDNHKQAVSNFLNDCKEFREALCFKEIVRTHQKALEIERGERKVQLRNIIHKCTCVDSNDSLNKDENLLIKASVPSTSTASSVKGDTTDDDKIKLERKPPMTCIVDSPDFSDSNSDATQEPPAPMQCTSRFGFLARGLEEKQEALRLYTTRVEEERKRAEVEMLAQSNVFRARGKFEQELIKRKEAAMRTIKIYHRTSRMSAAEKRLRFMTLAQGEKPKQPRNY